MALNEKASRIITLADDIAKTALDMLDVDASARGKKTVARGQGGEHSGPKTDNRSLLLASKKVYRTRRVREKIFDDRSLFADPAWDMLLDLFAAHLKGKNVSVTSACLAASVPATTALRWVSILEQANLITREKDEADARRVFVRLSPLGIEKLTKVFDEIA